MKYLRLEMKSNICCWMTRMENMENHYYYHVFHSFSLSFSLFFVFFWLCCYLILLIMMLFVFYSFLKIKISVYIYIYFCCFFDSSFRLYLILIWFGFWNFIRNLLTFDVFELLGLISFGSFLDLQKWVVIKLLDDFKCYLIFR